jgi:BCD family chlorophyll transporter-like MFS transporter
VVFVGLLNRVMLTELGFPGLLVGGALACEQLVAPARILFGQLSDRQPIAGRHRTPYILIGAALFCSLAVLLIPLIFRLHAALEGGATWGIVLGVAGLCGLTAVYGLAVSLATTPYLALVIDSTSEQERPRAVGLIWCLLTVGIVIGAIASSLCLKGLDGVNDPAQLEPALLAFMGRVALVVFALTLLATWGIESPGQRDHLSRAQDREEAITLGLAWRLITSSRQVLVFFCFLLAFTLAVFLQDPILESYGAEVFALPIAATASLSAVWGIGTLIGLLLAGLWLVPGIGKFACARLGCQLILLSLLLLTLVGFTSQPGALKLVLFLFGLATGIGTNATLVLMLDLTLPQVAGTFVGVWGRQGARRRVA